MSIDVLYEDNHLLIVNKPAGLPTMGVQAGRANLLEEAKQYIKRKYDKPGNVYLGIVSRLDAPTTGVLMIARTSKAAKRLNEQQLAGAINKTYLALLEGAPRPPAGEMTSYLRKDERHRKMHACSAAATGAQQATLRYKTLERVGECGLVEVQLVTGRKHQIRVQFSDHGTPIVGDRKYGANIVMRQGIALHSWKLELTHPVKKTPLAVSTPPPGYWRKLGVDTSGY